ncbi:MAG: DUF6485 family protein [bacterium]
MSECTKKENISSCSCTYTPCSRKGLCCQCIAYHHRNGELPGCLFPKDVERTYDRSIKRFVEAFRSQKG